VLRGQKKRKGAERTVLAKTQKHAWGKAEGKRIGWKISPRNLQRNAGETVRGRTARADPVILKLQPVRYPTKGRLEAGVAASEAKKSLYHQGAPRHTEEKKQPTTLRNKELLRRRNPRGRFCVWRRLTTKK